jgi:hypothetical protein
LFYGIACNRVQWYIIFGEKHVSVDWVVIVKKLSFKQLLLLLLLLLLLPPHHHCPPWAVVVLLALPSGFPINVSIEGWLLS